MQLSQSQFTLLETIHAHDGMWNDYKLGRACLSKLESPADFTLKPLLDAGLVEERPFGNEPLPRLHITTKGRKEIEGAKPKEKRTFPPQ